MAVYRMSSKELNKEYEKARGKVKEIESDVLSLTKTMESRLSLIFHQREYESTVLQGIKEIENVVSDRIVFALNKENYEGEYEIFGTTIHPSFIREPRNLFNLKTSSGTLFRSNATVYINGEEDIEAKYSLMKEGTKGKDLFFKEFTEDEIKLVVNIDNEHILGDTSFNTIEIEPYLQGSFDIVAIDVWRTDGEENFNRIAEWWKNVSKSRFTLPRKYEVSQIEFTIKLKHKSSNGTYPFGLHSLQFLNADYNPESYVLSRIVKNNYIEYVGNQLEVKYPTLIQPSSIQREKLEIYIDYRDGALSSEVEISEDDIILPLQRNTRELFIKYPIRGAVQSLTFLELKTI